MSHELNVDTIIERFLSVRRSRPGKQVYLEVNEIKGLCYKAREIFITQPVLLELEAPIRIIVSMRHREFRCARVTMQ